MYLADLQTSHFAFHALGATEAEARDAMRKTWAEHCREYQGAALTRLYTWREIADDVNVFPLPVGGGIRDGEPLYQPGKVKA
jgi:hypothetical protein